MEKNIDVLQNWLKDQGAEVAFLTDPENIAYFSGYHSEPHERVLGLAVFPDSEPFLFTPALEVEDVRGGDWTHPAYGYNDTENPFTIIADEIKNELQIQANLLLRKNI